MKKENMLTMVMNANSQNLQFTSAYVKKNGLELPDGFKWSPLNTIQKRMLSGLRENAFETFMSHDSDKLVELYRGLLEDYANKLLMTDDIKISNQAVIVFLVNAHKYNPKYACAELKGGLGKWIQTVILMSLESHYSNMSNIQNATAEPVKTKKLTEAERKAKMDEIIDKMSDSSISNVERLELANELKSLAK